MHELSIAIEILDLVLPKIPVGGRLQSVTVTAGLLSCICSDSLDFCFTELAAQEGHPGARLKMNRPPARFRCHACQTEYSAAHVETPCPACGSFERTMLSGTEFTVDFVEIQQGDHDV